MDDQFPLVVWQTGSGTQSNMNLNEVIAQPRQRNAGRQARRQDAGASQRPRQHEPVVERLRSRPRCTSPPCSRSRSRLLPALTHLLKALQQKEKAFADIVKIGRTHTQDATPLTLGQEFSGYASQVEGGIAAHHRGAGAELYPLAQGGTAVGTGLNAKPQFAQQIRRTRRRLKPACRSSRAPNKFEALAAHDAYVFAHGALNSRRRRAFSRSPTTSACSARGRARASAN